MKLSKQFVQRNLIRLAGDLALFSLGIALGALILSYLLAGDIYDFRDTASQALLPDVDAIVCLAGGRGRVAAAGDLWYRYWEAAQKTPGNLKVPVLYFSGMGHQISWSQVSPQIRKPILQAIRPTDIVIENESSNTDTNARWLANYAQAHRWRKIILLTSSYHMKRARFIFNHILRSQENPIQVETFSVYQDPFSAHEWRSGPNGIRVTLFEYLKWIYYRSVWKSL